MVVQEFSQYRTLAAGLAGPALTAGGDELKSGGADSGRQAAGGARRGNAGAGSVLLAGPAARLLLGDEPSLHESLAEGFRLLAQMGRSTPSMTMLSDPAGHTRDLYHPLVLHLHLAAFHKLYETLPVGLWGACEEALNDACLPVRAVEAFADRPPPSAGTARVLWQALCLLEDARLAARDVDVELIESVVHQIVSRPGPDGSLHERDESLDAWTYRELAGLHALANLAITRRNQAWAARVERIALHHLENTQPDNTTNQPWALAAFLWSPRTRSFAEQQLHDAAAQGVGPVAALLLADAAHTLAAFEVKSGK